MMLQASMNSFMNDPIHHAKLEIPGLFPRRSVVQPEGFAENSI